MKMEFRKLSVNDSKSLGNFFKGLSIETRKRFGPHPLTKEHALELCKDEGNEILRYVIVIDDKIEGYFILQKCIIHETERYAKCGVKLEKGMDLNFAPCISDKYQNKGLASKAMPEIIKIAKENRARSLVLMGGVQSTNERAVAFYKKFGFREFGGYQTEVYNQDMKLELTDVDL